jgi:hypothetical protein
VGKDEKRRRFFGRLFIVKTGFVFPPVIREGKIEALDI